MVLHIFFLQKLKANSDKDLSLEETLTFHNVIILIKSVSDQDQNHYYINIFLEELSYQLAKN